MRSALSISGKEPKLKLAGFGEGLLPSCFFSFSRVLEERTRIFSDDVSMAALYPSIAQCAVAATALKILLFPAYKSTDFEVSQSSESTLAYMLNVPSGPPQLAGRHPFSTSQRMVF